MIVAHQRAGARVANLLRELDLTGLRRWHLLLDPRLAAVPIWIEPCDVPRPPSNQHDAVSNPGRARLGGAHASAHVLQRRPRLPRVS